VLIFITFNINTSLFFLFKNSFIENVDKYNHNVIDLITEHHFTHILLWVNIAELFFITVNHSYIQ